MTYKKITSLIRKKVAKNETIYPRNYDDFTLSDGTTAVLWSIQREDDDIWLEMEDNSDFGKSMNGRYLILFVDVDNELYPHIIDKFSLNNK